MSRPSRREFLSLFLVPVTTTAGCVFQEGDWGTTVTIRNSMEAETSVHVEIIPESASEPVYETDLTLQGGEESTNSASIQTDANNLRIVVEVDHPDDRQVEERGKSGWDEIWVSISEDEINTGGSSTM